MLITKGNFKTDTENLPERRGWVIGSFVEDKSIFHSDEFEVKWAEHKKGYIKIGLKTDVTAKTVVFLVYGKFQVDFIDKVNGDKESVILNKLGDYLAYDAIDFDHTAEALEDCLVIVFRWPSKR